MTICPHCQTENRPEATFCAKCGAVLTNTSPGSPDVSLPITEPAALSAPPPPAPQPPDGIRSDTQPLGTPFNYTERPTGAVFGKRYLFDSLTFKDEREIRYAVKELVNGKTSDDVDSSLDRRVRVCTNPKCGAVHAPITQEPEQLCTQCGAALQVGVSLMLRETLAPVFGSAGDVASLGLTHTHIRAPLAAFTESVGGSRRYCLVTPFYAHLPESIEPSQVLEWGVQLAEALDYLHVSGKVAFGGQITSACFGMDGSQVVWCDFSNCNVPPDMVQQSQPADARALAAQLYQWLTGHTQYTFEAALSPALNHLFQEALVGNGFATAAELASKITASQSQAAAYQSIDFRLGRRTDVGRERTLNEDSVLTLELSRISQSLPQPLGVFVVADGMGGHSAGEVASGAIINVVMQKVFKGLVSGQPGSPQPSQPERLKWLKETVESANSTVYNLRKSAGTDMGSTLVIALVEGSQVYLAHAGDSRIYKINAQSIQQLTIDHSLVERLVATGQIKREEARRHPQRNVIYRTIGDKANIDVETSTHTLAPGDRLLLCSDGLSGMVEDQYLYKIVMEAACPQAACEQLIEAANAAGGDDNISAIVLELVAS